MVLALYILRSVFFLHNNRVGNPHNLACIYLHVKTFGPAAPGRCMMVVKFQFTQVLRGPVLSCSEFELL